MPIYEYHCATCGFQKEYLQKISDPLLKVCPECGKPTFNKMLTAAAFRLKGTGWYATDFKNIGAGGGNAVAQTSSSTSDTAAPAASCSGGCSCH
jgi:putative FmdB family regulatory protein